eukprot:g5421.t1
MRVQRLRATAVAAACSLLSAAAASAKPPPTTEGVPAAIDSDHLQKREGDPHARQGQVAQQWWRGGGAEVEESWLSSVALRMKEKASSAGSSSNNRALSAWRAYETRKSELKRSPEDACLQLETAEALLKWVRHTTNGNFPRVTAEGKVCDGDSPASRAIWRKHAPEALRLLKTGATHALDGGSSNGSFDLATYRFLQAEASTYLSSAKGVLRAALQADAVTFKRNVKPLLDDHPAYQGGVGHTFMGSFYLVAPWPVHNLAKAKAHFDAALKIDSRSPRNHYCRGLVALELGDVRQAQASFQRALRCKPTSPEEEDVGDFFHAESRGALAALQRREREGHAKTRKGLVDVSSRRCEAVGCAKWPLYGNEGEKAKFCSLHKSTAMIDVRSRRCAAPDCKRQPSYGFEGKRACFCAAHKAQGMVDVVSRRCQEPNCRRRPLYGYEGKKSQFCSAHKREGQVDVCNRRCKHPGCSKRPCFGLPGERPCYCGTHRSPEMVDVISHKCAYPGCSHPSGHEGNRTRSKFCDKHKSVGLAGASLLQLASAAAEDSALTAGTAQNAANLLPPPPQEETPRGGGNSSPRAGGLPEGGLAQRGLSEPRYTAVAEAPSRRASLDAPVAVSMDPLAPDRRDESRRSSMPTPLLPSVQSLLDDIPRSRLKRHREDGSGRSNDMDVDSPSSLLAPPAPAQELMRLCASGGGNGAERGGAAALGSDDGREGGGGSSSSGVTGMDSGSRGATAVAGASAHSQPAPKASRVFPGPSAGNNQEDGGWASRQRIWDPNHSSNSSSTGYMMASPSPDWRKQGLASLGRAASFDEMRAAANKNGLKAEETSQPRRASAFVVQASALSPVVTQLGRRVSALVPGRTPAAGRTAHYHDLLGASASSRSMTAFNGHPGYSPSMALLNPDARIEEESGGEMAASGGRAGEAPSSRPPTMSRAAAGMFHVMPATAAYSTGLPPLSPCKTASIGQGGVGDRRRYSFRDQGSPGVPEADGASTTLVPAWGAPAEGDMDGGATAVAENASEAGNPRAVSMTGVGGGNASDGSDEGYQRTGRRGSMAPPAPAGRLGAQPRRWPVAESADHDRGTTAENDAVPAWGSASEEKPGEAPANPSSFVARGAARRAKALFGGGRGAGAGDSRSGSGNGSGSETERMLVSQRSGFSGPGTSAARDGPGGLASGPPSGSRRWSVSEHLAPAPGQRGFSANAFVRPSWGEPAADREVEGPSPASSSSPVRQNNGGAMGSSRRGSMAPGAMLPPAPRRGSVVADGPVSTSSQRKDPVMIGT